MLYGGRAGAFGSLQALRALLSAGRCEVNEMSIAAPMVRALVEMVERAGVAREEFLGRAGVSDERLSDGSERFDAEEFDAIQRLALDLTGDEAFGLHLAEQVSEAAFDLLGHLISHAP